MSCVSVVLTNSGKQLVEHWKVSLNRGGGGIDNTVWNEEGSEHLHFTLLPDTPYTVITVNLSCQASPIQRNLC